MRSLSMRLTRMERSKARLCPCGGEPRLVVVMGEEAPAPAACPRCGTESLLVRITRGVPPAEWTPHRPV